MNTKQLQTNKKPKCLFKKLGKRNQLNSNMFDASSFNMKLHQ